MGKSRRKHISPVVDQLFPNASDEKRAELTTQLRPYFRLLYDAFCNLERRGLLDPDSRESGGNDKI